MFTSLKFEEGVRTELKITIDMANQKGIVIGKMRVPVAFTKKGHKLWASYGFSKKITEELKALEGTRWHGFEDPPVKQWSLNDSQHNRFQLEYLTGGNPYAHFDKPLITFQPSREICHAHQVDIAAFELTRQYCVIAGEMGCGKTLATIEAMEQSQARQWFWIAPKSAMYSVQLEFDKWNAIVRPMFYTYEGLTKLLKDWDKDKPPPQGLVLDEASRCKTHTAQRTQAAKYLADEIRNHWGDRGYVILMSGSPAPKSPVDWWSLCNIACPGFLKEGDPAKFRKRLAIMKEAEGVAGVYSKLESWLDDERKCNVCGKFASDTIHDEINMCEEDYHQYKPSKNEVSYLYKRMNGLVLVKLKKDCFSGNTEVLTFDGIRSFAELAKEGHANLYVKTLNGMKWVDCKIKSFGIQKTSKLTFGDGNSVRTTNGHQWLVRQDPRVKNYVENPFKLKSSIDLRIGKDQLPLAGLQLPEIDYEGYAHGFVFGDGHTAISEATNRRTSRVQLYNNDNDLLPLLSKYGQLGTMKRTGWQEYINVVNDLPLHWKSLPRNPTKSYAFGFILGLISADGGVYGTSVKIFQSSEDELIAIKHWAQWIGLRCQSIRIARELSPFDNSYKPLFELPIQSFNLSPDDFIRRDQKAALISRGRFTSTTVNEFNSLQIEEEVFCAVVPEYHNFTLANGVITRNCLDLPEKQYKLIRVKPSQAIINAAKLITATGSSAIKTLTLLRELSDGFQYDETAIGTETCPLCKGDRTVIDFMYIGSDDQYDEIMRRQYEGLEIPSGSFQETQKACPNCNGTGESTAYTRTATQVECAKENVLADLLDEHEDIGRLVVYAGFTGSVDRCVDIAKKSQWDWIRADGRGWTSSIPGTPQELLKMFQNTKSETRRLVFIGQPSACGMGITLHASPTIVYYSNDFNGESRGQSEDRIHRMGMDTNRGATIIDIIHLPSDELVIDNLKKKKKLQAMTLGEMNNQLANIEGERLN